MASEGTGYLLAGVWGQNEDDAHRQLTPVCVFWGGVVVCSRACSAVSLVLLGQKPVSGVIPRGTV